MSRTAIKDPAPGVVLAATIGAAVLVVANVSSLNVALPQLSRELNATQADVHWMIDIYAVFLAALLLPAGALGDRFGRRRMLLFGITVLVVANAATLAVDTPMPVILLRAVAGVGAAFVFPATLSTITSTLPDEQRGRGVAMWTAAVSIGGILGVMGSGLLIENFWWGSVFLAMAIASAAVLAFCWAFVPDSSDPNEANLDPLGAVLSFVAAGGLVLGVIEGPVKGWTAGLTLTGLGMGGLALAAFIVWEWRNPRPLLDVRLFANRGVRSGSLSIFVQFLGSFGFFFLTVPYLAFVLGYGPLKTGLGLLPAAIGLFPGSAVAIPLSRRFGRKLVGTAGLVILASAFAVGTTITVDSSFLLFATVMALFGLGLGLSGPPATEAIVEALPPAKQGVASALNDVLREFGAAIGIAAIGSAFNGGYQATVDGFVGFPGEIVQAVRDTPAAAAVIAPDLGPAGPDLLAAVGQAVVDGWGQGLWLAVAIVASGAVGYAAWAPGRTTAGTPVIDLAAGHERPATHTIRLRTLVRYEADLVQLEQAIASVNAGPAARSGTRLELVPEGVDADAVVAVMGMDPSELYELAGACQPEAGAEPPDVLVFTRRDAGPVFAQLAGPDPAAEWLSTSIKAGSAQLIAIGAATKPATEMASAITRRLDRWADRVDALAFAPRLGLSGIEVAEPLGAIEIAAAAEADVARVTGMFREFAHTIDLLEARSAAPPDMDRWPAAKQTIVAERAVLAIAAPLEELAVLSEQVLGRTVSCDSLVTGAHAELQRLGQQDFPLDELQHLCDDAAANAETAAHSLRTLADRFENLATLRSTLRPVAVELGDASQLATRAHQITQTWLVPQHALTEEHSPTAKAVPASGHA